MPWMSELGEICHAVFGGVVEFAIHSAVEATDAFELQLQRARQFAQRSATFAVLTTAASNIVSRSCAIWRSALSGNCSINRRNGSASLLSFTIFQAASSGGVYFAACTVASATIRASASLRRGRLGNCTGAPAPSHLLCSLAAPKYDLSWAAPILQPAPAQQLADPERLA